MLIYFQERVSKELALLSFCSINAAQVAVTLARIVSDPFVLYPGYWYLGDIDCGVLYCKRTDTNFTNVYLASDQPLFNHKYEVVNIDKFSYDEPSWQPILLSNVIEMACFKTIGQHGVTMPSKSRKR